jgi:hypothetical protein
MFMQRDPDPARSSTEAPGLAKRDEAQNQERIQNA